MASLWASPNADLATVTPSVFPVHHRLGTRWADNDVNGHLNNAIYYGLFDTAINTWLLNNAPRAHARDETITFVAESACRYLDQLSYPENLLVGIAVSSLGDSSVSYELGVFRDGDTEVGPLAALGRWVHVYVDATTHRPKSIPDGIRDVLVGVLASKRVTV
jgi:acyl-CoA thioester hydrolase